MSDTSANDSSAPEHPSMIGGHAKYIQGAISSALGYDTGEATKRDAINEMKAANEQSNDTSSGPNNQPAQSNILGTVEQKLGQLTGCEGMEKEGGQRLTSGPGSEETSGTG